MKTLSGILKLIIGALILLFYCSFKPGSGSMGQTKRAVLSVMGHLTNYSYDFKQGVYILYRGNTVIERGVTDRWGTMEVALLPDCQYMLELAAPGFLSKKILFITNLPEKSGKQYYFEFDIELINNEILKEEDVCTFDAPYAIIYYNSETKNFDYDKKYMEKINAIESQILSRLVSVQ